MGYPRCHLVVPDSPGFYHCHTRCVRRAFLCGQDPLTGRSFEHRQEWVEERIHNLANSFAVAVHAYAVMSNHLHLVVYVDPGAANKWSDDEVVRRWLRVYGPKESRGVENSPAHRALVHDKAAVESIRGRLGSLSWFMRSLKEPIARAANKEDDCTGRFWEGRFQCHVLLDERAVLACMTYVDLNPIRAGIGTNTPSGKRPSGSRTSMSHRIRHRPADETLTAIAGSRHSPAPGLSEKAYRELVEWTGTAERHNGSVRAPASLLPILVRAGATETSWLKQVDSTQRVYVRAIGSLGHLTRLARDLRQRWLKGIRLARELAKLDAARGPQAHAG